ncbi:hypothetical protein J3454_14185 [Erythrobacter sp. NFXS35]|uniref:hypothetical protein n=1 Tax=Erythrobacter sp. NFXS35 TaxID=2818436 RepID=UPI0032DED8CF
MAHYLITYDNRPPRNYQALYKLLESWRAVRLAESVWLAELKGPASTIRTFVKQALQKGDLVAVIELKPGSDWATSCAKPTATLWLSRNIHAAETSSG